MAREADGPPTAGQHGKDAFRSDGGRVYPSRVLVPEVGTMKRALGTALAVVVFMGVGIWLYMRYSGD